MSTRCYVAFCQSKDEIDLTKHNQTMSQKKTINIIDIGDTVVCDYCNDDYTNSDESGGILLHNEAVCPMCATVERYQRAEAICPPDMSFKDWVLKLRGGNNTIIIESTSRD